MKVYIIIKQDPSEVYAYRSITKACADSERHLKIKRRRWHELAEAGYPFEKGKWVVFLKEMG